MNRRFETEEFDAAMSASEVLPLLMLRRAIFRWRVALYRAEEAVRAASADPDPRLGRSAAHLGGEAETGAGLVVGALEAWTGRTAGVIFVKDDARDPGWLRVGLGEAARVADARPGVAGAPHAGDEVFDLVEAELDLMRRAIRAVVVDPEHQALCLAKLVEDEFREPMWTYFGSGGHTPASMVSCLVQTTIFMHEHRQEEAARKRGGTRSIGQILPGTLG